MGRGYDETRDRHRQLLTELPTFQSHIDFVIAVLDAYRSGRDMVRRVADGRLTRVWLATLGQALHGGVVSCRGGCVDWFAELPGECRC